MTIETLFVVVMWIMVGTVILICPWIFVPMMIAVGVYLTVLVRKIGQL